MSREIGVATNRKLRPKMLIECLKVICHGLLNMCWQMTSCIIRYDR